MLSAKDYKLLCSVRELPDEGFPEDRIPEFVPYAHMKYLIHKGFLEYNTLVPEGKEEIFPDGYRSVNLSYAGHDAISAFEKQLSNERWQKIQFAITALLAFLSVPGVIESVSGLIKLFRR